MTGIALTKLDVLTGFKTLKICTAYRSNGNIYDEFSPSQRVMERAKPVWEELEGWNSSLSEARSFEDLPKNARNYIRRLEGILKTEVVLISVGPGREQTILLKNPFVS